MLNPRLLGLLKLSFAHHPVCWQYRNHTIKLRSWHLCLGCTGVYSGFLIGVFLIVLSVFSSFSWINLVIISFILFLPTILRVLKVGIFNSDQMEFRFLFRFFLGLGISIGILSIFIIDNFIIQSFQILCGLGVYSALVYSRIKSNSIFSECGTCTFERSHSCPGFKPFYPTAIVNFSDIDKQININVIE